MKTVTKEQCEAALGSISDAIEEYCLVVNRNVYCKLEAAQDVIHQLIEEHEKLEKAHKKLLSLWGKDLNTWRDETSQLLQDAGFEDASKILGRSVGVVSMPTPKCKTCEYRNRNKCTRADGAILYIINWNHPGDVQIKTRPRWCPLKSK